MLADELGGLLNQLPRGLVAITCLAGLLWIALLAYFALIRPSRAKRREAAVARAADAAAPGFVPYDAPVLPAAYAMHDLPDLDLLTNDVSDPAPDPLPRAVDARRLSSVDVKLADGGLIHAQEKLIVLRDPRDGRLIVQMGDTGHKTLAAADLRAGFMGLMRELGQLVNEDAPTENAPLSEGPRPAAPASAPPVSHTPPSPTGSAMMPGDLPKYSEMKEELKSRGAFRAAKSEMPPIPELNIPAAIEAYLQYKKQFSPEYAQRSIHVLPAPGGGVRIEVDGHYFESVGDVTDPEIRAFLQATIQEWQTRQ